MQKDIVTGWAKSNGLEVSEAQINALAAYQQRVLEVNQHMNLTAITADEDFAVKHIIDSFTLLPFIAENATLIDVGTGAGFPGLVLRIMRPSLRLTLLDSLRKRVNFLRETANMLGFSDVECVHARAEDYSKTNACAFDIATARAVASLDKLAKWALPLVKENGVFLAMKGHDIDAEIEKAQPTIHKFGGHVEKVELVNISNRLTHSIVVIRKQP
jgi:16S rRNA (guanine527-N7)-methyltransferase